MASYFMKHAPGPNYFRLLINLIVLLFISVCFETTPVPQIKTQAPGFYRHMLGDFEITALLDGQFMFDTDLYLRAPKEEVHQALNHAFIPLPVYGPVSTFLINTNQHLVLIDAGAGVLFDHCCGRLEKNIIAAGYRLDQIDYIFLTHLHSDHYGGLAPNGTRAFANAIVRVSQEEADYWLNIENKAHAHEILQESFDRVVGVISIYKAAQKYQPFTSAAGELLPGIRPTVRFGHTPGHTHYFVESKGQTLLILGDILHLEAVQFPNPSATTFSDHNATEAIKSRLDLLNLASEKKYLIAGMHTGFPGIGHVRKTNGNFEWVPIQYEPDLTVSRTGNFSF